jgi:hypothetical protein
MGKVERAAPILGLFDLARSGNDKEFRKEN